MTSPIQHIEAPLLRRLTALVADAEQRDEMAAPSYLHGNPLIPWLFRRRLQTAADLLTGGPHGSGLDFGCGLGVLLPALAARSSRLYATDIELRPATELVATLRLSNVQLLEPAALEQQIAAGSLDYVVSTDVLEHVPDLAGCIATFARLLRPGGRLVVSGPTETPLYRLGRVLAGFAGKGHYHHTDVFRIREQIMGCGAFQLERTRVLPLPRVIEAFVVDSFRRSA